MFRGLFNYIHHIHIFKIWIRVKQGLATQHPSKYELDEKEILRVSALERIEPDDMRREMERAQAMVHSPEIREDNDEKDSDDGDEGMYACSRCPS